MIKHYQKTYHTKGITVNGNIDMEEGEIKNISKLCFENWSFTLNENDELCISYNNEVRARISNNNIKVNFHCERYFMVQSLNVDDCIGLFVSNLPRYYNNNISQRANEQALPTIHLSDEVKDPTMIGVIVDYEKYERSIIFGSLESIQEQEDNINRVLVSNQGTVSVWVCDLNGFLKNGDYITTSGISGYGMKQNEPIKYNYTGPKITQNCNFNPGIIVLRQPVSFDNKGPIYEPITNSEDQIISDVEYELKYIDLEGNNKKKREFIEELTKLSNGDSNNIYTSNGNIKQKLLFNPNRTIFRAAKVGCCFL